MLLFGVLVFSVVLSGVCVMFGKGQLRSDCVECRHAKVFLAFLVPFRGPFRGLDFKRGSATTHCQRSHFCAHFLGHIPAPFLSRPHFGPDSGPRLVPERLPFLFHKRARLVWATWSARLRVHTWPCLFGRCCAWERSCG